MNSYSHMHVHICTYVKICTFSLTLMVLLLYSGHVKAMDTKFPSQVHTITNREPQKFNHNDHYKRDYNMGMGMVPRTINGEPNIHSITEDYFYSEYFGDRRMPHRTINREPENVRYGEDYDNLASRLKPIERHQTMNRELENLNYDGNSESDSMDNVDKGMLQTYHDTVNQEPEGPSYYENSESKGNVEVQPRTYDITMNQDPDYENSESNENVNIMPRTNDYTNHETNYDEKTNYDEETNYDENSESESEYEADEGELYSRRLGRLNKPKPSECQNNGGECKSACHRSLRHNSRGCGRGQFCCLVAYRVIELY